MNILRWIIACPASAALWIASWAQLPLSVDTTFRVDLPAQNAFSVWSLEDGRLVISGNLEFPDLPNPRSGARLLPNGERDLTFNQGFLPMGGKITPWQNGYYSGNGPGVRRFLFDGQLDPDFILQNDDPYFSSLQGGDYHVYPDGRVLMTGLHTIDAAHLGWQGAYNLIWFTSTGYLDTTRTPRSGNGINWAIKEYPEGTAGDLGGRFLVHTWGTTYEGQPVDKVFRIHADGSLDDSFNSNIEWGYIQALEILPDGRAYIGGTFRMSGDNDTLQVIRVMPDGNLDPTFNNAIDMVSLNPTSLDAKVLCIYPIAPGLIVLGGRFNEVEQQPRKGICMIDTLGNLVSYFDGAATGDYTHFGLVYGSVAGFTQAPDGSYYLWGAYHGYSDGTTNDTLQRMVTRLFGGEIGLGVRPTAQPLPGMRLYPNPTSTQLTLELDAFSPGTELLLRDGLGKAVLRQRIGGHYHTVQVGTLPSGCYIAELLANGRRVAQQKLLVQ